MNTGFGNTATEASGNSGTATGEEEEEVGGVQLFTVTATADLVFSTNPLDEDGAMPPEAEAEIVGAIASAAFVPTTNVTVTSYKVLFADELRRRALSLSEDVTIRVGFELTGLTKALSDAASDGCRSLLLQQSTPLYPFKCWLPPPQHPPTHLDLTKRFTTQAVAALAAPAFAVDLSASLSTAPTLGGSFVEIDAEGSTGASTTVTLAEEEGDDDGLDAAAADSGSRSTAVMLTAVIVLVALFGGGVYIFIRDKKSGDRYSPQVMQDAPESSNQVSNF